MQRVDPSKLERAFLPSDNLSFAEVITRLENDPDLAAIRVRDLISGLRRVAKALGRSVEDTPAVPTWLQPRIAKVSPAAIRLSPKSWQNTVSDAKAALARCGIVKSGHRRKSDLAPGWRELWDIVLGSGDPTLQPALGRFVYFLSGLDVSPTEVCETHAHAYHQALQANEISKDPERAFRAAVNGWNLAVRRVPQWPRIVLPLAFRQKVIRCPEDVLHPRLIEELDEYLRRRENPDPFADEGHVRSLRPASSAHYRRLLLRLVGRLVRSGIPLATLDGLKALTEPALVESGLRQMLTEAGNETSVSATPPPSCRRRSVPSILCVHERRRCLAWNETAKRASIWTTQGAAGFRGWR